ncbi:FkbM family methyltransferase [Pleurocapsales cyanobacterium LEGE 06147]|nr:FkbM family methyltransferase [Pleurocapsales cyanobacterium LEGE 06147]
MKPHEQGTFNQVGKTVAKPLSLLVANSMTQELARLLEAYWCILLGKGAGTGWAFDAEIKATQSVISTSSPVIFDVGANKGKWALLLNQVFPQSRIFLFEPQPVCQQIISDKKIPNSTLIPKAVSSAKRSVKLCTPKPTAGIASLHQRRDSYFQDRDFTWIDVETVTIDDVVSSYNLTRVDFMKMDIEGHELEALKGAATSLANRVIRALSFEFGSGNVNSRTFFHDFWDLLHPLGYQIYRILPSSQLMHIKEYYEDCEYFRGVTNYIAVLQ